MESSPNGYRITKTELVWPGKYSEQGQRVSMPRANLPFQVIERINESRATREAKKKTGPSLFDVWEGDEGETFEEGWRNKLIWGDNFHVMSSLLEKFAGTIDLIYIDPPFATGADFSFNAEIGESDIELTKSQSVIEEKAYRDTWARGTESYLSMLIPRLNLMRDLLSEDGSIYVHLDWHVSHYVKLIMDDVFGRDNFQNEVIWAYRTQGATKKRWSRKHDVLLFYSKSNSWVFNTQYERSYMLHKYGFNKDDFKIDEDGRQYRDAIVRDIWEIPAIQSGTHENLGYRTQKPRALLDRIIKASSNEGQLVADFFCGSGTMLEVAETLGRRWIGCDLGRWGTHVTRKRLLDVPDCKPFEVLNLGSYERQFWQGTTFGSDGGGKVSERALYEYLAFVLKLYGAQPVAGFANLHGKKGSALVHVGAVDAPVTVDEIGSALEECAALRQSELHILGWEWEMGLAGPNNDYHHGGLMQEEAMSRGINLLLLQIPREVMEEQAVDRGDVKFFELAYLDANVQHFSGLRVAVSLSDFAIPNTDLIPKEVRDRVTKWSDYIDYWAIDWDFRNDSFIQGWVAYRTRRDRSLPLESDRHLYEKPGIYRVAVKVIDIFGNDTTQAYTVEVE